MMESNLQIQLRRRMEAAGYNQKSLARAAGLNETAVRDILKARSKSPRIDTLDALARTLRCSVAALRADEVHSGNSERVERIEVIGALDAGGSEVSIAWSANFRYVIDVPKDHRYQGVPRFALEVVGRTIERLYEGHAIVICVRLEDLSRGIEQGERVIAEIERPSGEPEIAIMKYIIDRGDQAWLWPQTNEGHQPKPIRLDTQTPIKAKVMALVVGSYRRE